MTPGSHLPHPTNWLFERPCHFQGGIQGNIQAGFVDSVESAKGDSGLPCTVWIWCLCLQVQNPRVTLPTSGQQLPMQTQPGTASLRASKPLMPIPLDGMNVSHGKSSRLIGDESLGQQGCIIRLRITIFIHDIFGSLERIEPNKVMSG